MNTCYRARFFCPAGLFPFGLLDGLPVRLCRPYLREASVGLGFGHLAMVSIKNPG